MGGRYNSAWHKEYYKRNKERLVPIRKALYERTKKEKLARDHASTVEKKTRVIEYLGGKCLDCAGIFPYFVYDVHHLDPKTKDEKFNAWRKWTWEKIVVAIQGCVLLCSNCHRIRHDGNPRKTPIVPAIKEVN